jgi:5-methyltetrahydrofolate--homocysteine methyltransferase
MAELKELSEALQQGDMEKVKSVTAQALENGRPPEQILSEGLIAGMDVLGAKFKNNEVFLPEVLMAARAMHAGLDILKPKLTETGAKPAGRIALGTVKGDLHDIGKNLVGIMFQGAGFEVHDLGTDVSSEKFVQAVEEEGVHIVGMSALLSTTMPSMRKSIEALHRAGLAKKVKIMVGGAPVTQRYADEIGADGYAPDAASAVDVARKLIGLS